MNGLTFPGVAANLDVKIISPLPDPQDAHCYQKLWIFKNQEQNPASLLNRVEILEDHGAHFLINVFFKAAGCSQMKACFSDLGKDSFFCDWFHEEGYCQLVSSNSTSIKTVLNRIIKANQLESPAQKEMASIVKMIQKQEDAENIKAISTVSHPLPTPLSWYRKAWTYVEKACSCLWNYLKWFFHPCKKLFSN